jgi:hypothetical protein
MSLDSVKFPFQVYTYNGGSDYYDLTLTELSSKCCIYDTNLYWTKTIPEEEEPLVDTFCPTLYDIANYDASSWYEWPEELKNHLLDAIRIETERKAELRAKGLIY